MTAVTAASGSVLTEMGMAGPSASRGPRGAPRTTCCGRILPVLDDECCRPDSGRSGA
jgi:hypothetical protein